MSGSRYEVVWQVLPGGLYAPMSTFEDLLGDTDALLADLRLLVEESRELIAESRKIIAVGQMLSRARPVPVRAPVAIH